MRARHALCGVLWLAIAAAAAAIPSGDDSDTDMKRAVFAAQNSPRNDLSFCCCFCRRQGKMALNFTRSLPLECDADVCEEAFEECRSEVMWTSATGDAGPRGQNVSPYAVMLRCEQLLQKEVAAFSAVQSFSNAPQGGAAPDRAKLERILAQLESPGRPPVSPAEAIARLRVAAARQGASVDREAEEERQEDEDEDEDAGGGADDRKPRPRAKQPPQPRAPTAASLTAAAVAAIAAAPAARHPQPPPRPLPMAPSAAALRAPLQSAARRRAALAAAAAATAAEQAPPRMPPLPLALNATASGEDEGTEVAGGGRVVAAAATQGGSETQSDAESDDDSDDDEDSDDEDSDEDSDDEDSTASSSRAAAAAAAAAEEEEEGGSSSRRGGAAPGEQSASSGEQDSGDESFGALGSTPGGGNGPPEGEAEAASSGEADADGGAPTGHNLYTEEASEPREAAQARSEAMTTIANARRVLTSARVREQEVKRRKERGFAETNDENGDEGQAARIVRAMRVAEALAEAPKGKTDPDVQALARREVAEEQAEDRAEARIRKLIADATARTRAV
jgi:hypothetical protein